MIVDLILDFKEEMEDMMGSGERRRVEQFLDSVPIGQEITSEDVQLYLDRRNATRSKSTIFLSHDPRFIRLENCVYRKEFASVY